MKKVKLYQVKFGKPEGVSGGNWISFGGTENSPLLVIANSYEQAIQKAITFRESEQEKDKPKSIVTYDGSLNIEPEPSITEVKLISENVLL